MISDQSGLAVGRPYAFPSEFTNDPLRLPPAGETIPPGDQRITEISKQVEAYYRQVAVQLKSLPQAQERCVKYLLEVEEVLSPPVVRSGLIQGRLLLTKVQSELTRALTWQTTFTVVAAIIYTFAGILAVLSQFGSLSGMTTAQELNKQLFLGVPRPVFLWAIIGTFTSMLMRAGHFAFADRNEALRWLLLRPITGVVVGVVTYLTVMAGMVVLAGTGESQTPELLWVIAFAASFSDTLSISLLQQMLGRFRPIEASARLLVVEDASSTVTGDRRVGHRDGAAR